jgi:hypothetical protein
LDGFDSFNRTGRKQPGTHSENSALQITILHKRHTRQRHPILVDRGSTSGANHAHSHVRKERVSSRRDFLGCLMGTTLAGASMVESGWHRGAWARAAAKAATRPDDDEKFES